MIFSSFGSEALLWFLFFPSLLCVLTHLFKIDYSGHTYSLRRMYTEQFSIATAHIIINIISYAMLSLIPPLSYIAMLTIITLFIASTFTFFYLIFIYPASDPHAPYLQRENNPEEHSSLTKDLTKDFAKDFTKDALALCQVFMIALLPCLYYGSLIITQRYEWVNSSRFFPLWLKYVLLCAPFCGLLFPLIIRCGFSGQYSLLNGLWYFLLANGAVALLCSLLISLREYATLSHITLWAFLFTLFILSLVLLSRQRERKGSPSAKSFSLPIIQPIIQLVTNPFFWIGAFLLAILVSLLI